MCKGFEKKKDLSWSVTLLVSNVYQSHRKMNKKLKDLMEMNITSASYTHLPVTYPSNQNSDKRRQESCDPTSPLNPCQIHNFNIRGSRQTCGFGTGGDGGCPKPDFVHNFGRLYLCN